jgi:hypothetical protein
MARVFRSNIDMNGDSRVVNLLDPSAAQDAATKAYVDSAVEGLAWKDSCRVRTATNVNIASPGAALDSISLSSPDRVLLAGQTAPAENGIYNWNGAAVAMTRALDCSTAAELEQAIATVEEGTSAGTTWRQTSVNFTLGSGAVAWTQFGTGAAAASEVTAGVAELATQAETDAGTDDLRIVTPLKLATYSGRAKRAAATFGDGSATSYAITHNLGTLDVDIAVYRLSDGAEIECDKTRTNINTVTLAFSSAVAASSLRAVIQA